MGNDFVVRVIIQTYLKKKTQSLDFVLVFLQKGSSLYIQ